MKVKIRVDNDYEDLDEPIVVEKWVDAAVPGTQLHEDWAEEWLMPETGCGRYAGATVCEHCGLTITETNLDNGDGAVWIDTSRAMYCDDDDTGERHEPKVLERTPDAVYTVEVLECEEIPFLVGKVYEWGG